jgi:hypothetical protein
MQSNRINYDRNLGLNTSRHSASVSHQLRTLGDLVAQTSWHACLDRSNRIRRPDFQFPDRMFFPRRDRKMHQRSLGTSKSSARPTYASPEAFGLIALPLRVDSPACSLDIFEANKLVVDIEMSRSQLFPIEHVEDVLHGLEVPFVDVTLVAKNKLLHGRE